MARSGDPALDDPFFRVVRERHPDLDLVLLPVAVAAPATETSDVRAAAGAAVREADATLAALFTRIDREPMGLVSFWSSHDLTGERRRVARAGLTDPAPLPLLRALGDALLALGWDARPYADGSHRLRGLRGDLVCEAAATEASLRIAISSRPFPLSDATAAALDEAQR